MIGRLKLIKWKVFNTLKSVILFNSFTIFRRSARPWSSPMWMSVWWNNCGKVSGKNFLYKIHFITNLLNIINFKKIHWFRWNGWWRKQEAANPTGSVHWIAKIRLVIIFTNFCKLFNISAQSILAYNPINRSKAAPMLWCLLGFRALGKPQLAQR